MISQLKSIKPELLSDRALQEKEKYFKDFYHKCKKHTPSEKKDAKKVAKLFDNLVTLRNEIEDVSQTSDID